MDMCVDMGVWTCVQGQVAVRCQPQAASWRYARMYTHNRTHVCARAHARAHTRTHTRTQAIKNQIAEDEAAEEKAAADKNRAARTHARTHTRTRTCTRARTHARTHALMYGTHRRTRAWQRSEAVLRRPGAGRGLTVWYPMACVIIKSRPGRRGALKGTRQRVRSTMASRCRKLVGSS